MIIVGGNTMETSAEVLRFGRVSPNSLVPEILTLLSQKVDIILDERKVQNFKDHVVDEVFEREFARFKAEHPIRHFLYKNSKRIPLVFIALCVFLFLFSYMHPSFIGGAIIALTIALAFDIMGDRVYKAPSKTTVEEWQTSPLQDFRGEYKSDLPGKICLCQEVGCSRPIVIFEVESHSASKTRFLLAYKPEDPNHQYYVDWWEKPEESK